MMASGTYEIQNCNYMYMYILDYWALDYNLKRAQRILATMDSDSVAKHSWIFIDPVQSYNTLIIFVTELLQICIARNYYCYDYNYSYNGYYVILPR